MEKFLHALNCAVGADRRVLARWFEEFKDWQFIWEQAEFEELARAAGRAGGRFAVRLLAGRRSFDVNAEFARLWDRDIVVVSRDSRDSGDLAEYPKAFLHLPDAPLLLYRKGAALGAVSRRIAVVGTRKPSKYGEKIAYDLAEALAEHGVTIVSGLAFGIDAVAHFAAVSCGKPTIAVLGSGLFDVTPSSHRQLAARLLECGGTLLSEYPPRDPAFPNRFLERNRIIAGLCEATVVIEAPARSGALATARFANDYGKTVHALVGDINREQSQGCLQLIYDGATPLVSIVKFLEDLKLQTKPARFSPDELKLLEAFENKSCSTDELVEKTLMPIGIVNVLLTQLESKAVVRRNRKFLWEMVPEPKMQGATKILGISKVSPPSLF